MKQASLWAVLGLLLSAYRLPSGDIQKVGATLDGNSVVVGNAQYAANANQCNNANTATNAQAANTSVNVVSGGNVITNVVNANNYYAVLNGNNSFPAFATANGPGLFSNNTCNISLAIPTRSYPGLSVSVGGSTCTNDILIGNVFNTATQQLNTQNIIIGQNISQNCNSCVRTVNVGTNYGYGSVAANYGVAVGTNVNLQSDASTAIGFGASVPPGFPSSVALGVNANVTAPHQIMLGTSAETVVHPGPTAVGGSVASTGNTLFLGTTTNPNAVVVSQYTDNAFGEQQYGLMVPARIGTNPASFNSGILSFGGYDANHIGILPAAPNPNSVFVGGSLSLRAGDGGGGLGAGWNAEYFYSPHAGPFHAQNGGSAANPVFQICNTLNAAGNAFVNCSGMHGGGGTLSLDTNGTLALAIDTSQNSVFSGTVKSTFFQSTGGQGAFQSGSTTATFANNANTGMYITPTTLALKTNNLPVLTADANQNSVFSGSVTAPNASGYKFANGQGLTLDTAITTGFGTYTGVRYTFATNNEVFAWGGAGQTGAFQLQVVGGSSLSVFNGAGGRMGLNVGSISMGSGTIGSSATGVVYIGPAGYGVGFPTTTSVGIYSAGTLALSFDSSQNATFANNVSTKLATMDPNGQVVPSQINTGSYYWDEDFIGGNTLAPYYSNGSVLVGALFSLSGQITASTVGAFAVNSSSATQGGLVSAPAVMATITSPTITYRWRELFNMPAVGNANNNYTAYIGGFHTTGAANSAFFPGGGPYIKYNQGLNSGNWILGAATAANSGGQTTANSTVAVTPGSHALTITLTNGTYTYVLDGTTLGTVASGLPTTVNSAINCGAFGIASIPDGTNWTANAYVVMDRADFYVTGLSR